jgi:hypothetical protein
VVYLQGHTETVAAVAVSPNGVLVASGAGQSEMFDDRVKGGGLYDDRAMFGSVRVWLHDGTCKHILCEHAFGVQVCVYPPPVLMRHCTLPPRLKLMRITNCCPSYHYHTLYIWLTGPGIFPLLTLFSVCGGASLQRSPRPVCVGHEVRLLADLVAGAWRPWPQRGALQCVLESSGW